MLQLRRQWHTRRAKALRRQWQARRVKAVSHRRLPAVPTVPAGSGRRRRRRRPEHPDEALQPGGGRELPRPSSSLDLRAPMKDIKDTALEESMKGTAFVFLSLPVVSIAMPFLAIQGHQC